MIVCAAECVQGRSDRNVLHRRKVIARHHDRSSHRRHRRRVRWGGHMGPVRLGQRFRSSSPCPPPTQCRSRIANRFQPAHATIHLARTLLSAKANLVFICGGTFLRAVDRPDLHRVAPNGDSADDQGRCHGTRLVWRRLSVGPRAVRPVAERTLTDIYHPTLPFTCQITLVLAFTADAVMAKLTPAPKKAKTL